MTARRSPEQNMVESTRAMRASRENLSQIVDKVLNDPGWSRTFMAIGLKIEDAEHMISNVLDSLGITDVTPSDVIVAVKATPNYELKRAEMRSEASESGVIDTDYFEFTSDVQGVGEVPMVVRIVRPGERHGLNGMLTNDTDEELVEFYDARYDFAQSDPDIYTKWLPFGGQFIARYYWETLSGQDGYSRSGGEYPRGLDLQGDEPAWKVDAASMKEVMSWLRDQIGQTESKESRVVESAFGLVPTTADDPMGLDADPIKKAKKINTLNKFARSRGWTWVKKPSWMFGGYWQDGEQTYLIVTVKESKSGHYVMSRFKKHSEPRGGAKTMDDLYTAWERDTRSPDMLQELLGDSDMARLEAGETVSSGTAQYKLVAREAIMKTEAEGDEPADDIVDGEYEVPSDIKALFDRLPITYTQGTAEEMAKAFHRDLQEYAQVMFDQQPTEVLLFDPDHPNSRWGWEVSWEGGAFEWASAVLGGQSLTAREFPGKGTAEFVFNSDRVMVEPGYSFSLVFTDD